MFMYNFIWHGVSFQRCTESVIPEHKPCIKPNKCANMILEFRSKSCTDKVL